MEHIAVLVLLTIVHLISAATFHHEFDVVLGRITNLMPDDLGMMQPASSAECRVEVVEGEPMTLTMGDVQPHRFRCGWSNGTVQYTHHGIKKRKKDLLYLEQLILETNKTITYRYKIILNVIVESYKFGKVISSMVVEHSEEFSSILDRSVIKPEVDLDTCMVKIAEQLHSLPAYGDLVIGADFPQVFSNTSWISCRQLFSLGLRYKLRSMPSPNQDSFVIAFQLPSSTKNDLYYEWLSIPVQIRSASENSPPKPGSGSSFLLETEESLLTPLTLAVISATDQETPAENLIFYIQNGVEDVKVMHLAKGQQVESFTQADIANFNVAVQSPNIPEGVYQRIFLTLQVEIFDSEFLTSGPVQLHLSVRPIANNILRVFILRPLTLLEGQARRITSENIKVTAGNNYKDDLRVVVAGGPRHGRVHVAGNPVLELSLSQLLNGSMVYEHDHSDSNSDYILLTVTDLSVSSTVRLPIHIVPLPDSSPRLINNRVIKVSEGGKIRLSSKHLLAVSVSLESGKITYLVTEGPFVGHLSRRLPWSMESVKVKYFTQKEINNQLISYEHSGKENYTDTFLIKIVDSTNSSLYNTTYKVDIEISPVDDRAPVAFPSATFSGVVDEGEILVLSSDILRYTDKDSPEENLVYVVSLQPRMLEKSANAGNIVYIHKNGSTTPVSNFTQQQVNHLDIGYEPDKEELGPYSRMIQFGVRASDESSNEAFEKLLNVTILPVNDQSPSVIISNITMQQGRTFNISNDVVLISDEDNLIKSLTIRVTQLPLKGHLLLRGNKLGNSTFGVLDLEMFQLQYVHDNLENGSDWIGLSVSDGPHDVQVTLPINIELSEKSTKNVTQYIQVPEGNAFLLDPLLINTSEGNQWVYVIQEPLLGRITINGIKTDAFSMDRLSDEDIVYKHSGTEIGISYAYDIIEMGISASGDDNHQYHTLVTWNVTVTPVDNKEPSLQVLGTLTVQEGGFSVVDESLFMIRDPDTSAENLQLVVASQPRFGYLQNISPEEGSQVSRAGQKVSYFSLSSCAKGDIAYVQHEHSGEPLEDHLYLQASDGHLVSTSQRLNVRIIPTNDEQLQLSVQNLTVEEGRTGFIQISVVDADRPPDAITLTILTVPSHATLYQRSRRIATESIPLDEWVNERVFYQHDNSETTSDTFILSATDGRHTSNATCYVTIVPVNDEHPRLVRNLGVVGGSVISGVEFFVSDADTPASEIRFELMSLPTSGYLQLREASNLSPWRTMSVSQVFTQDQVNRNLVRFQPNPLWATSRKDGFRFRFSDGRYISPVFEFPILSTVPQTSIRITAGILKLDGEEWAFITPGILSADPRIRYHITRGPVLGNIERFNVQVTNFTQRDVLARQIVYRLRVGILPPDDVAWDKLWLTAYLGDQTQSFTLRVNIHTKKDVRVVKLSSLLIEAEERGRVVESRVGPQQVLVEAEDTPSNRVIFSLLISPSSGTLLLDGLTEIRTGDRFTQEDINLGRISIKVSTIQAYKDSFIIRIEQPATQHKLRIEVVVRVNEETVQDQPVLSSPTLLRMLPNHVTGFLLSSDHLQWRNDNDIFYEVIRQPMYGRLIDLHAGGIVYRWRQHDVAASRIAYVVNENEWSTSDSFEIRIKDGRNRILLPAHTLELAWSRVYMGFKHISVCEGQSEVEVAIKRVGNLQSVSWATVDVYSATAHPYLDYVASPSKYIQFHQGRDEEFWSLRIVKDDIREAEAENVTVSLTQGVNAILMNPRSVTVSIHDHACSVLPTPETFLPPTISTTTSTTPIPTSEITPHPSSVIPPCDEENIGSLRLDARLNRLYECNGRNWQERRPSTTTETHFNDEWTGDLMPSPQADAEPPLPVVNPSCLSGKVYVGSCHIYHNQRVSWMTAAEQCHQEGARLGVPDSHTYNRWLNQYASQHSVWMGLTFENGDWHSYPGNSMINYANWRRRTSERNPTYTCAVIMRKSKWSPKSCSRSKHRFICVKEV